MSIITKNSDALRHLGIQKLLTGSKVAELLDLPVSTVYQHARTGLLPCVRIGRLVRFRPDDIAEFIASGGASLPGGWRREMDEATREPTENDEALEASQLSASSWPGPQDGRAISGVERILEKVHRDGWVIYEICILPEGLNPNEVVKTVEVKPYLFLAEHPDDPFKMPNEFQRRQLGWHIHLGTSKKLRAILTFGEWKINFFLPPDRRQWVRLYTGMHEAEES